MFIAGNPKLVIEQCKAGIVGSFPALNARPKEALDEWLTEIETALAGAAATRRPTPSTRSCTSRTTGSSTTSKSASRHKVPIIITSLRAPHDVVAAIHAYGGIVLHDVINVRHAEKALEAGVDGLILVCAGAGGHAGTLSPFALIGEVRRFFDGPIVLSGAIASGDAILAAQAAGADLAYIGTRFLATPEASVPDRYKDRSWSRRRRRHRLHGPVLGRARQLPQAQRGLRRLRSAQPAEVRPERKMNFGTDGGVEKKVWRDIWSAGQGVGRSTPSRRSPTAWPACARNTPRPRPPSCGPEHWRA